MEDLSNALNQIFKRIQVEKITIPQGNGRPRGFAFVDLSWAADAPVKMFDICVTHSAMIFVNSRPIYLRELDSKANSESSDQSMGSSYTANNESSDQSMASPYTVEEAYAKIAYLQQELSKAMKTMKDQEENLQQKIAADNLSDSLMQ